MVTRVEQVVARHKKGYNCAQAVVCTYCDLFGMDEATAYRASEGFGKGMGGMRDGACGAISGGCLILSLANSVWGAEKGKTKQGTYNLVQEFCSSFKAQNGSILCSDLLGLGTPGVKRACDSCISDAALLLECCIDKMERA